MTRTTTTRSNDEVFSAPEFCRSYKLNNQVGYSIQRTMARCIESREPTIVYFGHSPWIMWGHSSSFTISIAAGATMPIADYFVGIDMADFRHDHLSDVIFTCAQPTSEESGLTLVESGRCWIGLGCSPLAKRDPCGGILKAIESGSLLGNMRKTLDKCRSPGTFDLGCLDLHLLSHLPRARRTTMIPSCDGPEEPFCFVSEDEFWTSISMIAPMRLPPDERGNLARVQDIALAILGRGDAQQEKTNEAENP